MKNKILITALLLTLMLTPIVLAQDPYEWSFDKWLQGMLRKIGLFTVVGGNTCNTQPDASGTCTQSPSCQLTCPYPCVVDVYKPDWTFFREDTLTTPGQISYVAIDYHWEKYYCQGTSTTVPTTTPTTTISSDCYANGVRVTNSDCSFGSTKKCCSNQCYHDDIFGGYLCYSGGTTTSLTTAPTTIPTTLPTTTISSDCYANGVRVTNSDCSMGTTKKCCSNQCYHDDWFGGYLCYSGGTTTSLTTAPTTTPTTIPSGECPGTVMGDKGCCIDQQLCTPEDSQVCKSCRSGVMPNRCNPCDSNIVDTCMSGYWQPNVDCNTATCDPVNAQCNWEDVNPDWDDYPPEEWPTEHNLPPEDEWPGTTPTTECYNKAEDYCERSHGFGWYCDNTDWLCKAPQPGSELEMILERYPWLLILVPVVIGGYLKYEKNKKDTWKGVLIGGAIGYGMYYLYTLPWWVKLLGGFGIIGGIAIFFYLGGGALIMYLLTKKWRKLR